MGLSHTSSGSKGLLPLALGLQADNPAQPLWINHCMHACTYVDGIYELCTDPGMKIALHCKTDLSF